jgi:hypothetical protein
MRKAVVTLGGMILLYSTLAYAEIPPILRAGTHAMWASFGMGGAINVSNSSNQFKLSEEFGYHFFGNASGPALALDLQEAFGNDFVTFEIGPKFMWDIALNPNLGVYLSPQIGIGYAYVNIGDGYSMFNLNFGFAGKMILGDRGYVFFQPIGFDLGIRGEGVAARYDLMFGGGAIF